MGGGDGGGGDRGARVPVPGLLLDEDLEHSAGLFVEEPSDSLDSSTRIMSKWRDFDRAV